VTAEVGVDTFAEVSLLDSGFLNSISNEINKKKDVDIIGVNNQAIKTIGVVELEVQYRGDSRRVEFVVVDGLKGAVKVGALLGLDAHTKFGGLSMKFSGGAPIVQYGPGVVAAAVQQDGWIEDSDGWYRQRPEDGAWVFRWRWVSEPTELVWKGVYIYERKLKTQRSKELFEKEMEMWRDNGFIVPYDESTMGEVRAILPLNPVLQPGKTTEVRPTCDYTELNEFITGTSDREHNEVCAESLRKWRKHQGLIVADLSKAYMRVHVPRELWKYQALKWNDQWFALTRLGFGLVSAPRALKVILDRVLKGHEVEAYRDDLCVGVESREHRQEARNRLQRALTALEAAGFPSKAPVEVFAGELTDPINILGLQVFSGENGVLQWRRKAPLEKPDRFGTLRELAGIVGRYAPGNLPILSWARPYAQILRSMIGKEAGTLWKASPSEELVAMTLEFVDMMVAKDPAEGRWCTKVTPGKQHWTLCCDASQIAMGAILIAGTEIDLANAVEDYCWINTKPRQINVLEAEAVVRGLTEAEKHVQRDDDLTIVVDSKTAYSWVQKALSGEILRCNSLSGPLLTRRLSIIHDLASQFASVRVVWVKSAENPADTLTRINARWVSRWRTYANVDWEETAGEQKTVVVAATVQNIRERIRQWQLGHRDTLVEQGGEDVDGLICIPHGSRRGVFLPMIPGDSMRAYVELRHEELGHSGRAGMWQALREEAAFPEGNLTKIIRTVSDNCDVCARRRSVPYESSRGTVWGRYPWEEVFMDCLTLPGNTFSGLIAAVDGFSRFAEVKPVQGFSASSVVEFLEELRARYGSPKVLRVDHGREFDNLLVKQWCHRYTCQLQFSSVANPRSQAVVERFNRTILEIMRGLNAMENSSWEAVFTRAVGTYNTRPHSSLDYATPREVFMGRKEVRVERYDEVDRAADWESLYKPLDWEVMGEHSWVPRFRLHQSVFTEKLKPKDQLHYEDATIESIGMNRSYVVRVNGRTRVVHESKIRPRSACEEAAEVEDYQSAEGTPRDEQMEHPEPHVNLAAEKNFKNEVAESEGIFSEAEKSPMPRRSARRPKPNQRFDM